MRSRTLVVVLLLVGACRPAEPARSPVAVGADATAPPPAGAVEGLTVTVTTDRPSVPAGQRLRITITVRNTGGERRTLDFTSGCTTDYEFLDAEADRVVASSLQMCTQALGQRTLAAGESFTDTHVWVRGLLGMPELPAGRYRVRGVLLATNAPLRSPPVPVTVP